jgi:hypothetical protein
MEATEMKILRMSAEYGAPPLFNPHIDHMGHVELSELGISSRLLAEIAEWDAQFQRTFSQEYPPDSRFESDIARDLHNARGKALADRLQEELGGQADVQFRPLR